ncbi:hypothetical protein F5146DRAFT_61133 [Armillaria mellea]|nr:hypothetical protein F5146DRAFT_61133 [Armillaria mellea]
MSFISRSPNNHRLRSLKKLPHVQKLTLYCWDPTDDAAEPISLHGVILLHLFRLPISRSCILSVADMYSHLILPSLRHLIITFIKSDSPYPISLPVVTNPDSCPIESLRIHLHHLSQAATSEACTQLIDEVIKFLRRTPKCAKRYLSWGFVLPCRRYRVLEEK